MIGRWRERGEVCVCGEGVYSLEDPVKQRNDVAADG